MKKVEFVEPRQKGDASGAGVPLPDELCEIAARISGETMTVSAAMKQFKAKLQKGWTLRKADIQPPSREGWNGMILVESENKGVIHCWRVICWKDDPVEEMHRRFEVSAAIEHFSLPENLQELERLLGKTWPTTYRLHYPYLCDKAGVPNHPHLHTVPDCLCVTGDGSPIFRLQVMDKQTFNRFKLVVMMTPWWSMSTGIGEMPDPGCGEYDFPFYDFNINEGDEFDYAKLIEVIHRGIEQINSRGERKWGIKKHG